jgi:hypothetical protein
MEGGMKRNGMEGKGGGLKKHHLNVNVCGYF